MIDDVDSTTLHKRGYVCEAGDDWVCPDGYLKIQDRCYGLVMQNATYLEAEKHCQTINKGHLGSLSTNYHVRFFQTVQKHSLVLFHFF